jgi:predicted PurR-regulated permease PerM
MPAIDSAQGHQGCRAQCCRAMLLCIFPRPVAVLMAVCLVLCVLGVVGIIVAASILDLLENGAEALLSTSTMPLATM